jgi:hypothetical protein
MVGECCRDCLQGKASQGKCRSNGACTHALLQMQPIAVKGLLIVQKLEQKVGTIFCSLFIHNSTTAAGS